ncbi:MAG: DUF1842 domain-containing protein [Thermoanaerobaculia bacterium]|nr:DUF1842 domain-containing protein [Thermoanaerobaculia bacterium]
MKKHRTTFLSLALLLSVASVSHAAEATPSPELRAFLGCYSIDTGLAGGPTLHLSLVFENSSGDFTGYGQVTQALANPVVLEAKVYGTSHELFILGSPYRVIFGKGYPDFVQPLHSGIGPVLLPILEFSLNTPAPFSIGGQKGELPGKGRFRYRTSMAAEWGPWLDGSVDVVTCPTR